MHIAEELKYCELDTESFIIKKKMKSLDYDVFGITDNSELYRYIEYDSLDRLNWRDSIKTFNSLELIADSTPLVNILPLLKNRERIFVLYGNEVRGIITRSDLQKISVRMFFFGLISLLEMKMTKIIRDHYPDDSWKDLISPNRLQKAETLFYRQKQYHENIELLDCLQFADKNTTILKSQNIIKKLEYSKNNLKSILRRAETLRNNIAHSRDFFEFNSSELIDLSIDLDSLLLKMASI